MKNKYELILLLFFTVLSMSLKVSAQSDSNPRVSPSIKTFALNSDVAGAAANSVNLFTGDVALPLSLVSVPGHNGLDMAVSISYSSNVQKIVNTWNLEAPTSIVGLGWNMEIPKIVVDNKQTAARDDDDFYLLEGGGAYPLIRTGDEAAGIVRIYETKDKYQFWKIRYYTYNERWEITKEDGTTFVYGNSDGIGTIIWSVFWDNWTGSSSQTLGQQQQAQGWNLYKIVNPWGEFITYSYENVENYVGSSVGKKHTEASYLKQITDQQGRKIIFFYKDKASFAVNNGYSTFYMEPHTEQTEPDAYQESYEKNYLDRIDVLREDGSKFLSVQLGYSALDAGTNQAKMLLASIVQLNGSGKALPGMKFSYYTTGNTKGFLQTVTYPTTGTVTYSYTSGTIGHSDRQLVMQDRPNSGIAEPKAWVGDDYVVVARRKLGYQDVHDINSQYVSLNVFQWAGEWINGSISAGAQVMLDGDANHYDYKDFQLQTQKNFFAILSRQNYANNIYRLNIFTKDKDFLGMWQEKFLEFDCSSGLPTLLSGDNFVAVGTKTNILRTYTLMGTSWVEKIIAQPAGNYRYAATNNYIICNNISTFPDQIFFNFLSEDKQWLTRTLPSNISFNSGNDENSYWHPSSGFTMVLAAGNPELVYRWDPTYSTFYLDGLNKSGGELFGSLIDASPVFTIDNSMIGIMNAKASWLARYDGKYWYSDYITATQSSLFVYPFAYGNDMVIRQTNLQNQASLKEFNPNLLQWRPDKIISGKTGGSGISNVGLNYFSFNNDYYYRKPNGNWLLNYTYTNGLTKFSRGGYPQFDVWYGSYPYPIAQILDFKNGSLNTTYNSLGSVNFLNSSTKFPSRGSGYQTIVSYPSTFTNIADATYLQLNRVINDNVTGKLMDYPVNQIAIFDGKQTTYTSINYNFSSATSDPSGSIAQYNEVILIPGSETITDKSNGYTKNFFYNAVKDVDFNTPPVHQQWTGLPYATKTFDSSDKQVASSQTIYTDFLMEIFNTTSLKVGEGYFTRPTQSSSSQDGIENITTMSYQDENTAQWKTGQLLKTTSRDFDSKLGNALNNETITRYSYFWQHYDPDRTRNILSPVIQTKTSISTANLGKEEVVSISTTTWKEWNGIFAPHKTYSWKRKGTGIFDFASWSGPGEPTSVEWLKLSEIDRIDSKGNPLQISTR